MTLDMTHASRIRVLQLSFKLFKLLL